MRKSAIVVCLMSFASAWGQTEAVIEIDATKIEHPIPRTIYGTFLEPIGHSTYGGLWAQVLENRASRTICGAPRGSARC